MRSRAQNAIRALIGLVLAIAFLVISYGLALRYGAIAPPPFSAKVVGLVAAGFLVYKTLIHAFMRKQYEVPSFGRDLAWEGLAIGVSVIAVAAAAQIVPRVLPDYPEETRILVVGGIGFLLLAFALLCENFLNVDDLPSILLLPDQRLPNGSPLDFAAVALGINSYCFAFLLLLTGPGPS